MVLTDDIGMDALQHDDRPIKPDDIVIPVMGVTGAGKSSFIATCTGEERVEIGHSLTSCTSKVSIHSMRLSNRAVHLIDCPGFDDTGKSDCDTLQELAFWLTVAYENAISISGVIYLHRITDPRVQGAALKCLDTVKKLCGPENYHAMVMVTTMWGKVTPNDRVKAETRQQELCKKIQYWADIKHAGGVTVAFDGSRTNALELIRGVASKRCKLTLAIQRQLIDEGRLIYQTDAGRIIYEAANDQLEIQESKLEEARISLREAQARRHYADQREWNEMSTQIEESIQTQRSNIDQLRKNIKEMQQEWTKESKWSSAEIMHDLAASPVQRNIKFANATTPALNGAIGDLTKVESNRNRDSARYGVPSVMIHDTTQKKRSIVVAQRDRSGRRITALTMIGTTLGGAQLAATMLCNVM